MAKSLPSRPNLEQLKHQAKDLLKSRKSAEALKRIRDFHPRWSQATESEIRAGRFSLSDAQLVIAREYGFATWPKLKQHVPSRSTRAIRSSFARRHSPKMTRPCS